MHHLAVVLLFVSFSVVLPQTTLYLLDCGTHGERMLELIRAEGYNGTLFYLRVNLTECPWERLSIEDGYAEVLLREVNSSVTDLRLSLSFGEKYALPSSGIRSLLESLGERVRIYAAAGNDADQGGGCYAPARQEGVLAVSSADSRGNIQYNSDSCGNKPMAERLWVSACFTSDATAVAAALGLRGNLTRLTFCPHKYQWQYMALMAVLLLVFLLVVGIVCVVKYKK